MKRDEKYEQYFYSDRNDATEHAAREILSLLFPCLPPIHSALDVGCGVGTWLNVLHGMGVEHVCGMDGPWVDEKYLQIPLSEFRRTNFDAPLPRLRRYDLALSLEVAEHLPETRADGFVEDLTALSDVVLFSAAIPRQGGYHHVNEQWPSYWVEKFASRSYEVLDIIRPRIWTRQEIPSWYRENLLLFVSPSVRQAIRLPQDGVPNAGFPVDIVHPEVYMPKVEPEKVFYGLSLAKRAFKRKWAKWFHLH